MTWLLAWVWLKGRAVALFSWMRANPSLAVIIALSVALAWTWHGRNVARTELAQRIAAEKAATGAQKAVNRAAEVHYTEMADAADSKHTDMVAEAWDATARFINDRRVQPEDRTCKAPAAPGGESASIPPEVPTGAVMVDEADVRRCADAAVYAVAAHDWAQSLKVPEDLLPVTPASSISPRPDARP